MKDFWIHINIMTVQGVIHITTWFQAPTERISVGENILQSYIRKIRVTKRGILGSDSLMQLQHNNCQAQARLRHSGSLRLSQALTQAHSGSYSVTVTVTQSLG